MSATPAASRSRPSKLSLSKMIPVTSPDPVSTPPAPATSARPPGDWRLVLDGAWQLTGHDRRGPDTLALQAQVPGHVHVDLLKAGLIPDPFWRDQADQCQWVEQWDWTYERDFQLPADALGSWVTLEFAGLDTFAAIELNGEPLGRTANMFVPHRFEVGGRLRVGRNTLRVRIDSIWRHVEGKPRDAECAFENQERLYVRRMQCTFHWDWVHRFVSAGIWRPVTLHFHDRARIDDLFIGTREISLAEGETTRARTARLRVRWETELKRAEPTTAELEIIDPEGVPVWSASCTIAPGRKAVELDATLSNPLLWWPNGTGAQPLHSALLRLVDQDGVELDRREIRFGVRTVSLERLADQPGSAEELRTRALRAAYPERDGRNGDTPGESFTVRVNGQRIFCKGANWVPADPWPSRVTTEHYERLLSLARDANVNCLRAWGGGIYELPAFWETCDRLGILVAQDFMTACAHYPEQDPVFLAAMREEIPAVIRLLRNHASLAWWIGDNENGMKFDCEDPATAGRRVAEEITRPALLELDPDRPFVPTSPFGGRPNNSQTIGDVHLSPFPADQAGMNRDWRDYRRWIDDSIGRFNSECITAGTPSPRSLRKFLAAADIADPHSPLWYYHTKDNPYTDLRQFDMQRVGAEKLFGPLVSPAHFVARNEYVQYELSRLIIESARRQKGYNQGLLFWMFNDCWPATGWSFVDYYGTPKAAWFAMKRAFQPLITSIEEHTEGYRIWICNDLPWPCVANLRLQVQPWSGPAIYSESRSLPVPANSSFVAIDIPRWKEIDAKAAVLVCDIETKNVPPHRAWFFHGLPGEMAPPPTALSCTIRSAADGRSGSLELRSTHYARVVTIDSEVDVSDNYFDMLPGEVRLCDWSRATASPRPASFKVSCWNQET